jgi:hypothetical protein
MNHSEIGSFRPRFSISNPIAAALTRIERARAVLDAAKLSEQWLAAMRARALLLEAHHSTRIEGGRLTLEQAEQILAGRGGPEGEGEDARRLLNYREAREFAGGGPPSEGGTLTEGLIRETHRRLLKGVRAAAPGEYRRVEGYVVHTATRQVVHAPPPAAAVPALVGELVAWWNDGPEVHPVIATGIFQFQLAHIHPFLDGNGLTARLLSTLSLSRAGYDGRRLLTISQYHDRNRRAFHRGRPGPGIAGSTSSGKRWPERAKGDGEEERRPVPRLRPVRVDELDCAATAGPAARRPGARPAPGEWRGARRRRAARAGGAGGGGSRFRGNIAAAGVRSAARRC